MHECADRGCVVKTVTDKARAVTDKASGPVFMPFKNFELLLEVVLCGSLHDTHVSFVFIANETAARDCDCRSVWQWQNAPG
jgi:hypothetical protein